MTQDNILLITTDQQRFDTINAWGNTSIFTPHLNYMAAMGTSFRSCYASVSYTHLAPARSLQPHIRGGSAVSHNPVMDTVLPGNQGCT